MLNIPVQTLLPVQNVFNVFHANRSQLAVYQPNLEISRILLASGLELTETTSYEYTVLGSLLNRLQSNTRGAIVEIFRLFASHDSFRTLDIDDPALWQAASFAVSRGNHPEYYGSLLEISELFEHTIMLPFQQLDPITRLEYALSAAKPSDWTSYTFYSMLSRNGKLPMGEIAQLDPLWNYLAFAISMSLYDDKDYQGWESILREILDAGNTKLHNLCSVCDVRAEHGRWDWGIRDKLITPLFCCFFSSINRYWRYGHRRFVATYQCALEPPMLRWLSLLKGCNVDLQEYGRRERELLLGNHKLAVHCWMGQMRLHDIRYGPDPEDWALEWKEIDLGLNENEPCLLMPGDWLDESDCNKDEMDKDFHFGWQELLYEILTLTNNLEL